MVRPSPMQAVMTCSKDCSFLAANVETRSVIAHLKNAHKNAINSSISLARSIVAFGDDEGCIKDLRMNSST